MPNAHVGGTRMVHSSKCSISEVCLHLPNSSCGLTPDICACHLEPKTIDMGLTRRWHYDGLSACSNQHAAALCCHACTAQHSTCATQKVCLNALEVALLQAANEKLEKALMAGHRHAAPAQGPALHSDTQGLFGNTQACRIDSLALHLP